MQFREVQNGDITLRVATAGEGSGPQILCVHGWPELWYSWRHQLSHFADLGYRVAALDVRGYGGSSAPHEIDAYTMPELASDVVAVARALSDEPVILFGHDWGAPIVYATALLHEQDIRAVAGLSVPFSPPSEVSFLELAEQLYAGKFFYQLYFQKEGVAEAEVEADFRTALRKIYFAGCGDAEPGAFAGDRPPDGPMLEGLTDPDPFPAWMSEADMDVFVEAFEHSGFRGPLNRYRAQRYDPELMRAAHGKHIAQPACFIGGERDVVRTFVPGIDMYTDPGAACDDFRGFTLVEGVGHWVQQEDPKTVNAALQKFVEVL